MKWLWIGIISGAVGFCVGYQRYPPKTEPNPTRLRASEAPAITEAKWKPPLGASWRSWATRVGEAPSSEQLVALFLESATLEDWQIKGTAQRLIATRWAEVDPIGGLAYFQEQAGFKLADTRYALVRDWLLSEWLLLDRASALAAIGGMEAATKDSSMMSVLDELVARDPQFCLALLAHSGLQVAFINDPQHWIEMARQNPAEFAAYALASETAETTPGRFFREKGQLIEIAAGAMGSGDPQATLDWIKGLPKELRAPAMRGLLTEWVKQDPLAAAEHLGELKDQRVGLGSYIDGGRSTLTQAIFDGLAKDDLPAALDWIGKSGEFSLNWISDAISERIANGELSPQQAFEVATSTESFARGGDVLLNLLPGIWAGLEVGSHGDAFEWLRAQPAGRHRDWAMSGLVREWLVADPENAVAQLQATATDTERAQLIRQALQFVDAGTFNQTAEKIVEALPVEERVAAISQLFSPRAELEIDELVWGNFEPKLYASSLSAAAESPQRLAASERLAKYWGATDPESAIAWAGELPESESPAVVAAAARQWANYDAYALSQHLLEMPAGGDRDRATGELVSAIRKQEPDSAWQWVTRIDDQQARQDARISVAESWADLDPAEARAAVDAAEISVEEREALHAAIGQP